MGPFAYDDPHPEKSLPFLYLNTNKRGITLNLSTSTGKEVLRRLLQRSDVVVENVPPAQALALELEAGFEPTDECSLVERLGVPIEAVPAHHQNPKMTTGADLAPIVALLTGGN